MIWSLTASSSTDQANALVDYPERPTSEGYLEGVPQVRPPDQPLSAERWEWRTLNRTLGFLDTNIEISAMPEYQREIWKRVIALYTRLRRCLHGDR